MVRSSLRKRTPSTSNTYTAETLQTKVFGKDYDPEREEQTFVLRDGRTMGFACYGNPTGIPVFVFHGSPGCRYDGHYFGVTGAKFNLRIICPDRPGHGLSSFQPGRRLIEYPDDITQLAAHLEIPQYHVVGKSGGGPYAIACAYGSPDHELLSASVVAGMGHPDTVRLSTAGWATVLIIALARRFPSFLDFVFKHTLKNPSRARRQLDFALRFFSREDRASVSQRRIRDVFVVHLMQAFAQGPAGVIRDTQIFGEPWGFESNDVKRHVNLFHGTEDARTPLAYGQHYAASLPAAELMVVEGASHLTISDWDQEVFRRYWIFGRGCSRLIGYLFGQTRLLRHDPVSSDGIARCQSRF